MENARWKEEFAERFFPCDDPMEELEEVIRAIPLISIAKLPGRR